MARGHATPRTSSGARGCARRVEWPRITFLLLTVVGFFFLAILISLGSWNRCNRCCFSQQPCSLYPPAWLAGEASRRRYLWCMPFWLPVRGISFPWQVFEQG